MSDTPQSLATLLANVERLLLHGDDGMLDTCYFGVRFGHDSGHLVLRILPSVELARSTFEFDGNQFIAPKAHLGGHFRRASDGTITERTWTPPPPSDPPIQSSESLPNLGDENYVWRGYGHNSRGVIKLRVGRFLADLNAPTMADAERLARRLADLLSGG
jgi:hypothetical protein